MSIMYKPTEPLEVGIGESMPAEFIKEAERSRARIVIFTDEIKRLKTENAKLRELVRDMWEACPADGYYCIYHCEHYDKESESHCKLEDRMEELGIEVDG